MTFAPEVSPAAPLGRPDLSPRRSEARFGVILLVTGLALAAAATLAYFVVAYQYVSGNLLANARAYTVHLGITYWALGVGALFMGAGWAGILWSRRPLPGVDRSVTAGAPAASAVIGLLAGVVIASGDWFDGWIDLFYSSGAPIHLPLWAIYFLVDLTTGTGYALAVVALLLSGWIGR